MSGVTAQDELCPYLLGRMHRPLGWAKGEHWDHNWFLSVYVNMEGRRKLGENGLKSRSNSMAFSSR